MVFLSVFSLSDPPPLCQKTGRSRGLKSTQESLLVWEFSSSEINTTEIHEWILSTPVIRNVLGYSIMIAFRTRAHLVADLGAIFTSGINSLNITQNVWNDDDSLDQKHQQYIPDMTSGKSPGWSIFDDPITVCVQQNKFWTGLFARSDTMLSQKQHPQVSWFQSKSNVETLVDS